MSKHKHKNKRGYVQPKEIADLTIMEDKVEELEPLFKEIEKEPEPQPLKLCQTTSKLNFRVAPGNTTEIINIVEKGKLFYILGESKDGWTPVEMAGETKQKGYLRTDYLKEVVD